MADMKAALDRLVRAVDRLDQVAARRGPRPTGEAGQMAAELADARRALRDLSAVTDGVSRRLDGAIETLHAVLED